MADHVITRPMTDGEKLVWAAGFTASNAAGCNLPTAVRLATRAVGRLREADISNMPPAEQLAVREMRHQVTQETARTVHELVRDLTPRREMIARLASLCWRPVAECYFYGCIERAGHYLWRRGSGRPAAAHDMEDSIRRALAAPLDAAGVGGLCWNSPKSKWGESSYDRDETEGRALLTQRNGWTVVAFWDRSVDRRGACNAAFIVKGELTFAQAVRVARHRWPEVWARFTFDVVEVDEHGARRGGCTDMIHYPGGRDARP